MNGEKIQSYIRRGETPKQFTRFTATNLHTRSSYLLMRYKVGYISSKI